MIKQSDIISVRNSITNEEYKMMSDNIQINISQKAFAAR